MGKGLFFDYQTKELKSYSVLGRKPEILSRVVIPFEFGLKKKDLQPRVKTEAKGGRD